VKPTLEVIFDRGVQQVLDAFSACFGIRIQFYSPAGQRLMMGRGLSLDSQYCRLLQKKVFGEQKCNTLDESRRAEAAEKRQMITYRCHAGLREAVLPVYSEGQLLGLVMMGQFRSELAVPTEVAEARIDARDRRGIEASYARLPLIRPQGIPHVLRLFSILVDHIVSHHMISLRGDMLVNQVLAYIGDHVSEPIALEAAAAAVCRSASTVSHSFKKRLGKSFKHALIEAKLDKADELMQVRPSLSISEVAGMIGYEDPFHFSALYRKYRGYPPSRSPERRPLES
jgi:AraC-like DNA-binding protein/ligand-binding sensor protein